MLYQAKPFLKWAGGKSQLLAQLRRYYPAELASGAICRYVEPFLGGGAVYLDIAQRYSIQEAHLFDVNEELILAYTVVQRDPRALIEQLTGHRQHYGTWTRQRAPLTSTVSENATTLTNKMWISTPTPLPGSSGRPT